MATAPSVDHVERRRFVPMELKALVEAGFFHPDEQPILDDGRIVDQSDNHQRLFTAEEFERMDALGLFIEERVELIDGAIVVMSKIGSPHSACVIRLTRLLSALVVNRALVSVQNPIRLNDRSEPEPDLAVLRPRDDDYQNGHASPADILFLIEVMDTSGPYDRGVKLPLYAENQITELWLVDLPNRRIDAYRQPDGRGFREHRIFNRGEHLSPAAFPDVILAVDDILSRVPPS